MNFYPLKGYKNDLLLTRGIGLLPFNCDIGGDRFRSIFELERLKMIAKYQDQIFMALLMAIPLSTVIRAIFN